MKAIETNFVVTETIPDPEQFQIMLVTDRRDVYIPENIANISPFTVGFDLYGSNKLIYPNKFELIDTHIKSLTYPPFNLSVKPRSSLPKQGLWLTNQDGIIDGDYRNSIKMSLYNFTQTNVQVYSHKRYCQLVIRLYIPFTICHIEVPNKINIAFIRSDAIYNKWETIFPSQRTGGFGSTGE